MATIAELRVKVTGEGVRETTKELDDFTDAGGRAGAA
jgi:hypothetical protein